MGERRTQHPSLFLSLFFDSRKPRHWIFIQVIALCGEPNPPRALPSQWRWPLNQRALRQGRLMGGISPSALRIALGLTVPRSAADSVDAVTHSRSRLKRECEQLENTVNAHERLQIGY